jgi:hypothetical protein
MRKSKGSGFGSVLMKRIKMQIRGAQKDTDPECYRKSPNPNSQDKISENLPSVKDLSRELFPTVLSPGEQHMNSLSG